MLSIQNKKKNFCKKYLINSEKQSLLIFLQVTVIQFPGYLTVA